MVISQQGIAATSQALASQAGAQTLAEGGSAADAAIAANAVLGVVEPMMNGMGGDLFVLYWEAKTSTLTGLNASGPAPCALSPELLKSRGIHSMEDAGIHCVTVPGAVDGWSKMHARFGKLPWKNLFRPAIFYAEQGFPVSDIVQKLWVAAASSGKLRTTPETTRVFLPNNRPPHEGEIFRNPDLAQAYRIVAENGPAAFYRGEIAAALLATSKAMGGTMTADDLAAFSSEWVEPISIDYQLWRIYELPPNGQGMAALEMLNIMESMPVETVLEDPDGPLSPSEMHHRIEAMKLAYADVYRYNGDPRNSPVPVAELLSKDYARERAALIDPKRANGEAGHGCPPASDTVYLSVVDHDGNIASWIQSNYASFGSGITVQGMGFELQNRGAGFTLEPGHPNVLAGGKRPFHTIIPGFMQRDNWQVGFGIMGGANQPLAHAQFVSNVVDYGMNLQAAMEAPRFFKGSAAGCEVSIESRIPIRTIRGLSEMGHLVIERPEYSQEMGRGQAVMHDSSTRTNYAASDPRSDGAAVPEPILGLAR